MKKPVETAVETGWRIQLWVKSNGWTTVNEHPISKIKARNAGRVWKKDDKFRVRIVKVSVTTETFDQEEI